MTKLDLTRAISIKGPNGVIDRMKGPGFIWNKDYVMTALFANNIPGVYFDPSDKVPANWRKNLLSWTEDLTSSDWLKQALGGVASVPAVTNNFATAPDGTTTATRVVLNLNGGNTVNDISQLIHSTPYGVGSYNLSVWLKSNTGSNQTVILVVRNGQSAVVTVTNQWQQFSYTATSVGSINSNTGIRVRGAATGNSADVLMWHPQLEAGSTATDYQKITNVSNEAIAQAPNATLYQDVAGTTPAYLPGETVALMLDKSERLERGPEITQPFNSQIWTGRGNPENVTETGFVTTSAGGVSMSLLTIGKWYEISVAGTVTAGPLNIHNGIGSGNIIVSNVSQVSKRIIFQAIDVNLYVRMNGAGILSGGAISVRELPGNHATQSGASARPTLARHFKTARRNIIPNTSTILLAGAGATSTKTSYYPVTNDQWNVHTFVGANQRAVNGSVEMPVGATYTGSIYIDPAQTTNNTSFQIYFGIYGSQRARVTLNLADGVLTTSTAVGFAGYFDLNSYQLVALPDGKYRLVMTMTNVFTTPLSVVYGPWSMDATVSVATTSAQIEVGNMATTFQRIHSDFDMTEIGVPDVWFLSFDGVDDVMNTAAFTRTKAGFQTVGGFAVNAYNASSTAQSPVFGLPSTTERSFIGIRATSLGGASQIAANVRINSGTLGSIEVGSAFLLGEPFIVTAIHDGTNLSVAKNVNVLSRTGVIDVGTGEGAISAVQVGSPVLNMRFYGGFWRQLLPFGAHEIKIGEICLNEKIGAYPA